MMNVKVNLYSYLARIGFTGTAMPDLKTLQALHELHTRAIPFENLNPLLGLPVKLDAASLQEKLVTEKRGGYCFEQNGLFKLILEEIGFEVTPLAGRVLWNQPENAITRRTHMLLLVTAEGHQYFCDVGFGGQVMTSPLLFSQDLTRPSPGESYKVEQKDNACFMKTFVGGEWRAMYRFTLEPVPQIDYEVANWYTSTNPNSSFLSHLSVSRTDVGCRHTLNNTHLAVHYPNREPETKILQNAGEIKNALKKVFGIKLPDSKNLNVALEGVIMRDKEKNENQS